MCDDQTLCLWCNQNFRELKDLEFHDLDMPICEMVWYQHWHGSHWVQQGNASLGFLHFLDRNNELLKLLPMDLKWNQRIHFDT